MSRLIEIFMICVVLVTSAKSAPWSENNDLREYDLEWHCEQLCHRLFGQSVFNSNNSTCSCVVDNEDSEINWKRIKHNAKIMGLILEIIDSKSKRILKRETPMEKIERIKKLIAIRRQEKAIVVPPKDDNNNVEAHKLEDDEKTIINDITNGEQVAPKSDKHVISSETPAERIKRLRELMESRKRAKNIEVKSLIDNTVQDASNLENEEKSIVPNSSHNSNTAPEQAPTKPAEPVAASSETPAERIKRIRELIETKRRAKINNEENFVNVKDIVQTIENNDNKAEEKLIVTEPKIEDIHDHKIKDEAEDKAEKAVKLPSLRTAIKNRKVPSKPIIIEQTEIHIHAIPEDEPKTENSQIKDESKPHTGPVGGSSVMEKIQERRAKVRAHLKAKLMALRNRNKTQEPTNENTVT